MPADTRPVALIWLRRDLRLADHRALHEAIQRGFHPWLIYIDDPQSAGAWRAGAASRAWLRRSLASLQDAVAALGGRLLLRAGDSLGQLLALAEQGCAQAVFWNRRYEPQGCAADAQVKAGLRARGILAHSFQGNMLFEPWTIATQQGEPYRVFTPFWRNASNRLAELTASLPAPKSLPCPDIDGGPDIDQLFPAPRPAWDGGFWALHTPGEQGAWARLGAFLQRIQDYQELRDRPDLARTSGLSAHLAFGEVSPRQIIGALPRAGEAAESTGALGFVRELGWREFSYHLLFHFPHSSEHDLTTAMRGFAWEEPAPECLQAWQQGRTGVPMVDAGMRELWHTGSMHNRVRMVVASFLTKNLRYHWLHGARWFWDTLVDADLANNTQGWQWSAGTGADAAPYFRIFNPVSQGKRFDPAGDYVRRWIPELARVPERRVHEPWESAAHIHGDYPRAPIIDLAASRNAALATWSAGREIRSMLGD